MKTGQKKHSSAIDQALRDHPIWKLSLEERLENEALFNDLAKKAQAAIVRIKPITAFTQPAFPELLKMVVQKYQPDKGDFCSFMDTTYNWQRVQMHPILALPSDERLKDESLFFDFADKVMRAKHFQDALEKHLGTGKPSQTDCILQDEKEYRKNVLNNSKRTRWLDDVAFAVALKDCVKGYNREKGSFYTYFEDAYSKAIKREGSRMTIIAERNLLQPSVVALFSALNKYLSTRYIEWDTPLSDELCENIASELNQIEKDKRWTASRVQDIQSSYVTVVSFSDSEDADNVPQLQVAADEDTALQADQALLISRFFDEVRPDSKKTPRQRRQIQLLLTNDVLRPLHPEKTVDSIDQIDIYRKEFCAHGKQLYAHVFVMDYLKYLQWITPETQTHIPDEDLNNIKTLCSAEPQRSLEDKTAAEFYGTNNLSPARQMCQELKKNLLKNAGWL